MKRSGYRAMLHIYLMFFLALLGAVLLGAALFLWLITVEQPEGPPRRSDWPGAFTEGFQEEIFFAGESPRVTQAGLALLEENGVGLQLLDSLGQELFSFQRPKDAAPAYSNGELLRLAQEGYPEESNHTVFMGALTHDGADYLYLLHFPMQVSKITMYFNGARFTQGRALVLPLAAALFGVILLFGLAYGFWTVSSFRRLTDSIQDIAKRRYLPIQSRDVFRDIYGSLNGLDSEIRAADQLREQTEKQRKEWIANITHDLKTPLSPIRGYGELLQDPGPKTMEQCRSYGRVIQKNAAYMEALVDDLKLTYQLENGMAPINRVEENLVRFLRELAIDLLNDPQYENRSIHFNSREENIPFAYDRTLLARAFRNLILNAFVHGDAGTEVALEVAVGGGALQVTVADNGKGLTPEEAQGLFQRYYRGAHTDLRPEGTGLGLAIAKEIVELHGGSITLSSQPGLGTTFQISFPFS